MYKVGLLMAGHLGKFFIEIIMLKKDLLLMNKASYKKN
jgi:hypothetical protein